MPIYKCQTGDSNKFWEYEVSGDSTVIFRWGRIGLDGQEKTETHPNATSMQRQIDKKVREKIRKGYVLSSSADKKEEVKKADKLGYRNKIMRVQYVSKKPGKLTFLNDYDPKQYVYVEVKDSWQKHTTRYVLSKEQTFRIDSVAEVDRSIVFDEIREDLGQMAKTVREVLREIFRQVQRVLTTKMAAVGTRKLMLEDVASVMGEEDAQGTPEFEDTYNEIISSGTVSRQVVRTFAALGRRKLDL